MATAAVVSNARPEAVQAARLAHNITPTRLQQQQYEFGGTGGVGSSGHVSPRLGAPAASSPTDRDFNVKFIGDMEELTGGANNNKSPQIIDPSPPIQQLPHTMTGTTITSQPRTGSNMTATIPIRKPLGGPTPRTTDASLFINPESNNTTAAQLANDGDVKQQGDDDEDDGCHPFWVAWWNMLVGCWLIISGTLTIPFVVGHGATKLFYSIPVMYGDYTIWKWPDDITGFPSGVVAGFQGLFWGIVQGFTDWAVLPVRVGMKERGPKGVFKGIGRGIPNIAFKPLAGGLGFVFHPIFGIYKEMTKIDIDIRRDQPPRRRRQVSPV